MAQGRGITFAIEALDKFSAPIAEFNRKIAESTAGLRTLGSRMGSVGRESGLGRISTAGYGAATAINTVAAEGMALGSRLALIGGGIGYGFKKGFLDVASQFEDFQIVLNTLNRGDLAKSKKEMGWISDFAAKTPYELAEVTEAFVKLRSYGMEPMNGLLQTLGDTSSSMGKPLSQAVEAIADAVTGENERLKEFGIVGKKVGDKIVYSYTNAAGAQAKMMAKAGDRMAIQATLMKVWGEKFGGGMEAKSKGWTGMWSNLMDAWSRMSNKIMEKGAFDYLKDKLKGILDTIDRMSADGSLDALARQWGENITTGLKNAWEVAKGLATAFGVLATALGAAATALGGWENLGVAIVALMGLKFIVAVALLAKSFVALGMAIMTTPIGWFLGGIALVTAGFMLVWKNWEKITGWFRERTPKWILRMFGAEDGAAGGGADATAGRAQLPALPEVSGWERAGRGLFAQPEGWERGAMGLGQPLGASAVQRQVTESRSLNTERKESKLTVDFLNVPKGAAVRQSGAPVGIGVNYDLGPAAAW